MTRVRLLCVATLIGTLPGGCAVSPPPLDVEVETCCDANFASYRSYSVHMTGMPGFLEPYLAGGLDTVMAQKGLSRTLDRPDLRIELRFDQVFLTADAAEEDYFGAGVEPGDATRFMAAVSVDVFETTARHIVWSGRLSRIHNNPFGQPRGEDHKMQGIIDGFAELFADYPIRLDDR